MFRTVMFTLFTVAVLNVNASSAPNHNPGRTRVAIVLGETSAGKSELLNLMCDRVGQGELFRTGHTAASETSDCQEETIEMRLPQLATYLDRELDSTREILARTSLGRAPNALECVLEFVQTRRNTPLVVIDTPGLNDSQGRDIHHGLSITAKIQEVQRSYGGVDQFVIVLRGGSGAAPRFSNSLKNMLKEFGDNFVGSNQDLAQWLEHVTVVVTHWDYQTTVTQSSNPQQAHYPGDTSGEHGITREWVSKEINRELAETFGMDAQQQVQFAYSEPVQCVFLDSLRASVCLPNGRTRVLQSVLDRKLREHQIKWTPAPPGGRLADFDARSHQLVDIATGVEVQGGTLAMLQHLVREAEGELLTQLARGYPRRLPRETAESYACRCQQAIANDPWTRYVQAMAILQANIMSATSFQCQHVTQGSFVARRVAAGNMQGIRSTECMCQQDWSNNYDTTRAFDVTNNMGINAMLNVHGPGYLCAACRQANPSKAFWATWATGSSRGLRYGARGGGCVGGVVGAGAAGALLVGAAMSGDGIADADGAGEFVMGAGCVTGYLTGLAGSAVGGVVGAVGGLGHALFNLAGAGYATTTRQVATLSDGTQIIYSQ